MEAVDMVVVESLKYQGDGGHPIIMKYPLVNILSIAHPNLMHVGVGERTQSE